MNLFLNDTLTTGNNILHTILSIIIVFAVLAAIITGYYFISKLIDRSENKITKEEPAPSKQVTYKQRNTNITDDDMMAAVLVATIDFRNEIKEDVRLVSVREIK